MAELTIGGVDAAKLMAMGDGCLLRGDVGFAQQLYRAALRRTRTRQIDEQLRVRLGLCRADRRLRPTFEVLEVLEAAWSQHVFVGDGLATWLKQLPFMADARFVELIERHANLLPVRNWHWNLQTALWAVQRAKAIEGDFVELGVFKGHTTLFCAEYVDFANWPKRWWLYDTFEGIPEDQVDEGWAQRNTEAYKGSFSFEEVRERFAHIPNIDVIKGRVPEVLEAKAPERIAFLHVDLNNATAEVAALDLLFDRVSSGGVILFDDYVWSNSEAQYRAESAWFAARNEQVLPLPTGQGLFVKR